MGVLDTSSGPGGLQSVDRALHVLELLAAWGSGGVSELAGEIGVHKSTAFRLLGALEARNLVESRGQASIASHNWIGQLTPLHATSSGKVLLAYLEPAKRAELIGQGLERFT